MWGGPAFLRVKFPLQSVPEFQTDREIESFFNLTLDIPNSNWNDCLSELRHMQEEGLHEPENTVDLYNNLWRLPTLEHDAWENIR